MTLDESTSRLSRTAVFDGESVDLFLSDLAASGEVPPSLARDAYVVVRNYVDAYMTVVTEAARVVAASEGRTSASESDVAEAVAALDFPSETSVPIVFGRTELEKWTERSPLYPHVSGVALTPDAVEAVAALAGGALRALVGRAAEFADFDAGKGGSRVKIEHVAHAVMSRTPAVPYIWRDRKAAYRRYGVGFT